MAAVLNAGSIADIVSTPAGIDRLFTLHTCLTCVEVESQRSVVR